MSAPTIIDGYSTEDRLRRLESGQFGNNETSSYDDDDAKRRLSNAVKLAWKDGKDYQFTFAECAILGINRVLANMLGAKEDV